MKATQREPAGLTLVELMVAITIMSIISVATAGLLHTCLQTEAHLYARSNLVQEGTLIMERMAKGVQTTTYLLIPNAHKPVRDILAVSDMVNDDNDYYFGDPLFPRVDEDIGGRYAQAGYGILTVDDNGNSLIDETSNKNDDDEDGFNDEEILNGLDDDGDGNIDEDLGTDITDDNLGGIAGMDDDGDGQVDEDPTSGKNDEDEDGIKGEESVLAIVYQHDPAIDTLWEIATDADSGTLSPPAVWVKLSTSVTDFTVTYEPEDTIHYPRIFISLTLTDDDGESITLSRYVYPENIKQLTGKRVR